MKIKLDRTMCDGFGKCAEHAPSVFSLDEWGYASLAGAARDGSPASAAASAKSTPYAAPLCPAPGL